MSADNGIYILHTKDKFKLEKEGCYKNMFDKKIDAYRVVHTQAIDNFDWYKENELYNLGAYMYSEWGDSEVYYDLQEAMKKAEEISKEIGYTEYGTSIIDATKYSFYGF